MDDVTAEGLRPQAEFWPSGATARAATIGGMGVHYEFLGHVTINPPLNAAERDYLIAFSESRRWDRPSGPYTVAPHPREDDYEAEGVSRSASDHPGGAWPGNHPPAGQPGLWCDWTPCPKGCCLSHNGAEKFYGAGEWLRYVIDHFLRPGAEARRSGLACFEGFTFDHTCSGIVAVERRDVRELSLLHVHDNTVEVEVLVPGERVPW